MTEKVNRRKFLKASSATIVGAVGVAATSGTAAAHTVGTGLYTTSDLSVREGPGVNYSRIAVADQYTGGNIVDGPTNNDGYTWWKIEYNQDSDNGLVTGWSVEEYTGHADFNYPVRGEVSQEWKSGDHEALDIAATTGTPIHAAADGTVAVADTYDDSPCGKYVKLDHGGGWTTLYCHMSSVYVSDGESIAEDQHIGEVGDTGRSTGPHVHYAIRYNGSGQYVPGFAGQEINDKTGVPKNYR